MENLIVFDSDERRRTGGRTAGGVETVPHYVVLLMVVAGLSGSTRVKSDYHSVEFLAPDQIEL